MAEEKFESLYPGYDVLAKWNTPSWNEQTRVVVAKRLNEVPSRQFFTELQFNTLEAVCDRVIPQPDRAAHEKVPIAPWIDAKLEKNETNGTRYPPLPPQRECWRRGMGAIEAEAQLRFRRSFHMLDVAEQDMILHAMNKGDVVAPDWGKLPAQMFMRKSLLREIVEVYYAHPHAWSEIGFGGPASPRGYLRLGTNRRDPWEAQEHPNDVLREAPYKRELVAK
jgi:gluconate 2-dehydrogenase subunit 3-like protein